VRGQVDDLPLRTEFADARPRDFAQERDASLSWIEHQTTNLGAGGSNPSGRAR
jgi:hypothetical protein